ncbi:hypothetical protein [Noviherbaspirillum aerium]|uniref:hypothetical protein n=1 Tax=Noviherbaspirillum aerium TaxID=2588497 RepID=UPI001CEFA478|nr:hypothetical protein [Noviherbaspirillum aerium]
MDINTRNQYWCMQPPMLELNLCRRRCHVSTDRQFEKISLFTAMNTQTLSPNSLDYDPNRLLDTLLARLGVNSDKALSRKLQVAYSVISKIRSRRIPIAASLLLWMSECTGASINELRQILGDRRAKARMVYIKNSRPLPRA